MLSCYVYRQVLLYLLGPIGKAKTRKATFLKENVCLLQQFKKIYFLIKIHIPDFEHGLMYVDVFPVHAELEVGRLWAVKLLL